MITRNDRLFQMGEAIAETMPVCSLVRAKGRARVFKRIGHIRITPTPLDQLVNYALFVAINSRK